MNELYVLRTAMRFLGIHSLSATVSVYYTEAVGMAGGDLAREDSFIFCWRSELMKKLTVL
jgi:hypothetical protein